MLETKKEYYIDVTPEDFFKKMFAEQMNVRTEDVSVLRKSDYVGISIKEKEDGYDENTLFVVDDFWVRDESGDVEEKLTAHYRQEMARLHKDEYAKEYLMSY